MADSDQQAGSERLTQSSFANDQTSLLDMLLVLAENLRILVLLPLGAGLVALGIVFLISPTFTATTRILPPQQQQSAAMALANQLGALAALNGQIGGAKNPADVYLAMIKSRTVADRLIARFKLKDVYGMSFDDDTRKELANRTNVSTSREGLILISVDDSDPIRASVLANGYVEELHQLTQTLAVTEAAQRRLFFENRLDLAKKDLIRAEIALRNSGISESILKTFPQSAFEFVAELKAKITAQEIRLASMSGFMTETNPEYIQNRRELDALRGQLVKADRGNNLAGKDPSGADYISKYRDFKYNETLFELMAKQYELARLDEAREGAVIQVVDLAIPPEKKSKPKRVLIAAITTVVFFLLMVVVVFARHGFDRAIADSVFASKFKRLRFLLRI